MINPREHQAPGSIPLGAHVRVKPENLVTAAPADIESLVVEGYVVGSGAADKSSKDYLYDVQLFGGPLRNHISHRLVELIEATPFDHPKVPQGIKNLIKKRHRLDEPVASVAPVIQAPRRSRWSLFGRRAV